ncbi:deacetylase [Lithospermum erythrorhizon]|uniref:Deacetylase n=1 Tax=Lithospermum erythrorhizon TaxID=34254 RepID=A0AAV3RDG6_LITER
MGSLPNPVVVEDLFGILKLYNDGSIYRSTEIDLTHFPDHDDGTITWNDYLYDEKNSLYLRLYKPNSCSTTIKKLTIVYFLHGGGFCLGSRTWPNFHNCCIRLASALNVLVIAPDYRLAPENRLPAALEDCLNSLLWLQAQAFSNSEISVFGDVHNGDFDLDRVFVIGDSSGGNLAYHLAVRLGPGSLELAPVRVRGYVLIAPFLGGVEKTKSELKGSHDVLNLEVLDRFWRLSLPDGHDLDDPLSNPFGPKSPNLGTVSLDPILVMVGGNEVMKDRIHQFAAKLKLLGKSIRYVEYEGKHHGFFTDDAFSEFADDVLREIQKFISR